MSKIHLRFTTHIHGSPETIFDLVADLPNYGRWLPNSSAFGGTVNVTPYPVRLGTTYLDAGPIQKPGSVTGYERPKHISFRHTVQLTQDFLRTNVDARIRYTFDPKDGGTFVHRRLVLTFYLYGISRLALPLLLYGFRKENNRTLAALKRYVEAQPK
jgi:Polyketide cyclase / dehydrase and lipid transport